jgi:hypothetical protein
MFAPTPLPDISEIQKRLEFVFPEGTADRGYVTRDTAARTVFVNLSTGNSSLIAKAVIVAGHGSGRPARTYPSGFCRDRLL